ncbi:hypothetical protein EOI86_14785 [Hwanghaeella grinnelliae]|uniref:Uncharacterized protein n=1 Tax=Hwanghaeella grinnelliae TaxID=2500179 RepID=A0A437QPM4_9PROT|nr:hypothetical protein [Hwanghaeella grinnelliae]RVU36462.1 hypothetical protein EOI86_14785 [Hwanghaeella grinnelliae]
MIQLDGSTELEAILDGVFKPARREERRQRQRRILRGTVHQPLLTLNYPGAGDAARQARDPQNDTAKPAPKPVQVATTEDLIRTGYAEGRVINPPPPDRPGNADDATVDLQGLGYVSARGRIWSEGV